MGVFFCRDDRFVVVPHMTLEKNGKMLLCLCEPVTSYENRSQKLTGSISGVYPLKKPPSVALPR